MQNPDSNSITDTNGPSFPPEKDARHLAATWFERVADGLDTSRRLVANFGKLAFLMSKGAYLLEERRRLFQELGEKYFESMVKSKSSLPALDPETTKMVQTIERITKKIELEELLVRQFRFGYRPRRAAKT